MKFATIADMMLVMATTLIVQKLKRRNNDTIKIDRNGINNQGR